MTYADIVQTNKSRSNWVAKWGCELCYAVRKKIIL